MSPEALLDAIGHGRWNLAEEAAIELLHSGGFRDTRRSAIAAVLLAQTRVLGRLDTRGALTLLMPVIGELGSGSLEPRWSAQAHVVSAFVFAAPGGRTRDRARLELSLGLARAELSDSDLGDLRALAALAALGAGVAAPSCDLTLRHYRALAHDLSLASTPVTRVLCGEVRATLARAEMPCEAARQLDRALELAATIGFNAAEARITLGLAELSHGQARARYIAAARAAMTRGAIDARWLALRIQATERDAS